jgi:uncharacterized OB-fold protein
VPDEPIQRPLPVTDVESAPYWEALREHRYSAQHCADCSTTYLYPRALCPACHSPNVGWVELSGEGIVYSFTVSRRASAPAFTALLPLVVALVELDEGPRVMTNIVGSAPEAVRIGAKVELEYLDVSDEITLPVFRLAE